MNRSLLSHSKRNLDILKMIPSSQRIAQQKTHLPSHSLTHKATSSKHVSARQYHVSSTRFSSQSPSQSPKPQSSQQNQHTQNDPIKGAPFSELGASKTVKTVVIIAISIIATVETIAYVNWAYAWWNREKTVPEKVDESRDWWDQK